MAYKNPEDAKAYRREWYERNKEKHKANVRKNNDRELEWYRSLKDMQPCTDCGVRYPFYVMQFDHIGTDKTAGLAQLRNRGRKRILAEIAKCELVCANCHCIRTWRRLREDELCSTSDLN